MFNSLPVIKKDGVNFMSSVVLAKLCVPALTKTGKENKHQHGDFMVKAINVLGSAFRNFSERETYGNNNTRDILLLPEREACLMAMSYSYELQAYVFDEWQRIKNEVKQPALPTTYLEALEKLLETEKEKIAISHERDHAIKTKAEISDKKTATAMATASVLSRKVKTLESKLQDVGAYQSLIAAQLPQRIETELNDNAQTWRVLIKISKDMNLPPKKVIDERYGAVNTYHVDVINKFIEDYL